jgi:hypothetical protein
MARRGLLVLCHCFGKTAFWSSGVWQRLPCETHISNFSFFLDLLKFTTIGYGDLSPTTDAGRAMTMILAIYGITIVVSAGGRLSAFSNAK